MENPTSLQPWDEEPMRRKLLEHLRRLPRCRLDLLTDVPAQSGCYLQWVVGPAVEPVLGAVLASGRYPGYVGVAAVSLRDRIGRYRQSLRGTAIGETDLYVALLPLESAASALFAERAAVDALDPPLQGLGWGSKAPGANRREQSPVDALFPGRGWASTPSLVVQARARLLILSRLLRMDPDGPRWPPLTPAAAPRPAPAVITALGEAGRASGQRRRDRSAARHAGWCGQPG